MTDSLIGIVSMAGMYVLMILFVIYKHFEPVFHQSKYYVTILTPGKKLRRHFVAPKENEFVFKGDATSYLVDAAAVVNGKFNTPTLMYISGKEAPINLHKLELSGVGSSKDRYETGQNHCASDLMRSVHPPFSMVNLVLIIAIVTIVSSGFVYWKLNGSVAKLQISVDQIAAVSSVVRP